MNEIHDVHQRHLPSCVWRHIAPHGDKPCLWQKTAVQGMGQSIDRCADVKHIFGVRHIRGFEYDHIEDVVRYMEEKHGIK